MPILESDWGLAIDCCWEGWSIYRANEAEQLPKDMTHRRDGCKLLGTKAGLWREIVSAQMTTIMASCNGWCGGSNTLLPSSVKLKVLGNDS